MEIGLKHAILFRGKFMNYCEECGMLIEKIGLCPRCDHIREYNREDYTGIPGEITKLNNPEYSERGLTDKDFI
jgi:hypothetical protein